MKRQNTAMRTNTIIIGLTLLALCLAIGGCAMGQNEATAKEAVMGKVVDANTGQPIAGALITEGNTVLRTDDNGMFAVQGPATVVSARAWGYTRASAPVFTPSSQLPMEIRLKPFKPKALYLTYYGIGSRLLRGNALKLIDDTEANALVIDVKGDRGVLTYKSDVPLVAEIGAQKTIIVKDIKGLLRELKEKGIYTIARIVVFKDNVYGTARPDLAIRTKSGELWRDGEGLMWMDPSKKEVWEYPIDIAEEAAKNGFDEIQFDYVRFPDRKGLAFAVENTEENRVGAISGFLQEAQRRLTPYNVFISADLFGYAAWNTNDTHIGQRLDSVAPYVDYLALMLYPSGFQFGIPGYRNAVAHPYEIIARSLERAQERTGIPAVRFRPWLQDFRDYAFDGRDFAGPEVKTQILAAENFGSGGWMLWNPRNVYSAEGLNKDMPESVVLSQR